METNPNTGTTSTPPRIRLPDSRGVFLHRADRFRRLASGLPALADYLKLLAELSDIQHALLQDFPDVPLPDSGTDKPPLDVGDWPRDSAWRGVLRTVEARVSAGGVLPAGLGDRIRRAADDEMETWADQLLAAEFDRVDPGLATLAAAALQVYWTSLAARLDAQAIGVGRTGYFCPVCGSLPVSGVLQTGGPIHGLRYLCCGLCACEWNRPRINCIHCNSGGHVVYFGIEGAGEEVKAEVCSGCKSYIKLMNREKDAGVDPFADDIATLSLDILMADEGYERLGFNPLLIPSDRNRQG